MSLLPRHLEGAANLAPLRGTPALAHHGEPDAEARHLDAAALADWGHHGVVAVSGPDARDLLERVLASPAEDLAAGEAAPQLLLTNKGRVVALFHLAWTADDAATLLVDAPCREAMVSELQRLGRFSQADVRDVTAERSVLLVLGAEAEDAVAKALDGVGDDALVVPGALASPAGILVTGPLEGAGERWDRLAEAVAALDGGAVGWRAVEDARIATGVPAFGAEVTDARLPDEAGVGNLVSYTKGCFPGQEVVARVHNRGHVNRRTVMLQLEGDVATGDALQAPADPEAGVVTSVAGDGARGLGLVRREQEKDSELRTAGGAAARVLGDVAFPVPDA